MFPCLNEVQLYFMMHIYVEFLLHMQSNYTITPSCFCGLEKGHNYDHIGACRDHIDTLPPMRLEQLLSRSVVLPSNLVDPSHLIVEVRDVIVETMHTSMGSVSIDLSMEISRPPLVSIKPNVNSVDVSIFSLIHHKDLLQYTVSFQESYFHLYERCMPHPRGEV